MTGHTGGVHTGYDVMKRTLHHAGLPPQTQKPEESIREIPTEDHTTKHLASTPRNCQNHQEQEKSEKLPVKRSPRRHNN